MAPTDRPKTILITFAGRRDRMELLTRYADRAIEDGLIDEWHVWDFSRNTADARWLRRRFPLAQLTPSHALEYFALPRRLEVASRQSTLRFEVFAPSDVHIGLRRATGAGASYEIVLGGWNNQLSAIRRFDEPETLTDVSLRDNAAQPVLSRLTPELLPEFDSAKVEIDCGPDGVGASVQGQNVLRLDEAIEPGAFDLLYRTGYGSNGEWLFPETTETPTRLFVSGPSPNFPADSMFYTRAYQYYGAHRERYRNDIFLKCDDDIVFFDIARLRDFIAFRRENPHYFLVSANVVNNGVCAHFQQAAGAIPSSDDTFEAPPGGMCGSLWSSGVKAERLHALFLENPAAFINARREPILWKERISINFVSWLGEDIIHIPDIMSDDEHDLCYGVRKRARKANCIFPPFVAAHLSFWKQESEMNVANVISGYRGLAEHALSEASPSRIAESCAA